MRGDGEEEKGSSKRKAESLPPGGGGGVRPAQAAEGEVKSAKGERGGRASRPDRSAEGGERGRRRRRSPTPLPPPLSRLPLHFPPPFLPLPSSLSRVHLTPPWSSSRSWRRRSRQVRAADAGRCGRGRPEGEGNGGFPGASMWGAVLQGGRRWGPEREASWGRGEARGQGERGGRIPSAPSRNFQPAAEGSGAFPPGEETGRHPLGRPRA